MAILLNLVKTKQIANNYEIIDKLLLSDRQKLMSSKSLKAIFKRGSTSIFKFKKVT